MGTAGGSGGEHTPVNRCQVSQNISQKSYFHPGFIGIRARRVLPFLHFSSRKCIEFEKRRVAATSPRFRIDVFLRGNVGESETAKLLEPLGGHVQPGDAPGGLLGPAWWPSGALLKTSRSLPGFQNMQFSMRFAYIFAFGRVWRHAPLHKRNIGELLLAP